MYNVILLILEEDKYCGECIKLLESLKDDDLFKLTIYEINTNKGVSDYYGVKSVPTIVIDDEVRFIGVPPEHVLRRELNL